MKKKKHKTPEQRFGDFRMANPKMFQHISKLISEGKQPREMDFFYGMQFCSNEEKNKFNWNLIDTLKYKLGFVLPDGIRKDINPTHDFERLKKHRYIYYFREAIKTFIHQRKKTGREISEEEKKIFENDWFKKELKIIEKWLTITNNGDEKIALRKYQEFIENKIKAKPKRNKKQIQTLAEIWEGKIEMKNKILDDLAEDGYLIKISVGKYILTEKNWRKFAVFAHCLHKNNWLKIHWSNSAKTFFNEFAPNEYTTSRAKPFQRRETEKHIKKYAEDFRIIPLNTNS